MRSWYGKAIVATTAFYLVYLMLQTQTLMARQGNMKFIGTVDNLIFYTWKEIPCIRTKPTHVKQTIATVEQSKLFGIASHTGAVLRRLLKPVLPNADDKPMMRRFEQAIVQWLRTGAVNHNGRQTNMPFIIGFEFNEASPLHNRLKQTVTVDVNATNTISVNIPTLQPVQDITAPANTTAVLFTISAATCSLLTDDIADIVTKEMAIAYNDIELPAQKVELPVTVDPGTLTVVLLGLRYVVKGNITTAMKWLPAGVMGSVWGG